MPRPFFNHRIDQLKELAESSDPIVIKQILDELSHRNTAQARELREAVTRRFVSVTAAKLKEKDDVERSEEEPNIDQLRKLAESTDLRVLKQVLDKLARHQTAQARELGDTVTRRIVSLMSARRKELDAAEGSTEDSPSNDQSSRDHEVPQTPTAKAVAGARQKLLDLTRRNRLIHFGPGNPEGGKTTADSLVLMGNASACWSKLVEEELSRDILTLTKEEQAEILGNRGSSDDETEIIGHAISTRVRSTPESKPLGDGAQRLRQYLADGGLISPLALKESTAKLQLIYRKQQTLESSTGDSSLFLAIGFLDWEIEEKTPWRKSTGSEIQQSDRSQTRVCSPLLLVHVKLERFTPTKGGDLQFRLVMDADEAQGNPCLRQKFLIDHNLTLPTYDPEIHASWTSYIGAVQEATKRKAGYRIHPTICLGFFNFAKYRMWLDLDPAAWPNPKQLLGHTLISAFAERRPYYDQGSPPTIPSNDDVADHQADQDLPILLNADSSQYAALLAAKNDTSLVIVGPPGTGKSQTITNLIATALHAGKRVLFVAQKMPALDVVYERLSNVGVGALCLPLYTNKSRPVEVHQHLEEAERARRKAPRTEPTNRHLTIAASRLNSFARSLSDEGDHGCNRDVIAEANALRERAQQIMGTDFAPLNILLRLPSLEEDRDRWQAQAEQDLREWRQLLDATAPAWGPWDCDRLNAIDVPVIVRLLTMWKSAATHLATSLERVDPSLTKEPLATWAACAATLNQLPKIPRPSPWLIQSISSGTAEAQQVATLEALAKQYATHFQSATAVFLTRGESCEDVHGRVSPAVRALVGLLDQDTELSKATTILDRIQVAEQALSSFRTILSEHLDGVQTLGGMTWSVFRRCAEFDKNSIPAIPRHLNQRVTTYLLRVTNGFVEIGPLIQQLEELRECERQRSGFGIQFGNIADGDQEALISKLSNLSVGILGRSPSELHAISTTSCALISAWKEICALHGSLLSAFESTAASSLLKLQYSPLVHNLSKMLDIDEGVVRAVEKDSIQSRSISSLADYIEDLQQQAGRIDVIKVRAERPCDPQCAEISVIRTLAGSTCASMRMIPLESIRSEQVKLQTLRDAFDEAVVFCSALCKEWNRPSPSTCDELSRVLQSLEGLKSFPLSSIPKHLSRLAEMPVRTELRRLHAQCETLKSEAAELGSTFSLTDLPGPDDLVAIRKSYRANSGILRWLSSEWRHARRKLKSFCTSTTPNAHDVPSLLERLEKWTRATSAIATHPLANEVLGHHWNGLETLWPSILQLLTWIESIELSHPQDALAWLSQRTIADVPPTAALQKNLLAGIAWASTQVAQLGTNPSSASVRTALETARTTMSDLVWAMDALQVKPTVSPGSILELADEVAKYAEITKNLAPYSDALNGRSWTSVNSESFRTTQQWIDLATQIGLKRTCLSGFLTANHLSELVTLMSRLSALTDQHHELSALLGMNDAQAPEQVVNQLEAHESVNGAIRTPLGLVHAVREPTLGGILAALRCEARIRALRAALEPWSKALTQDLSGDDAEAVARTTSWVKAAKANRLPDNLITWIVASDPDHRAQWWIRLTDQARATSKTLDAARQSGAVNFAEASGEREIQEWHDTLPRVLSSWRAAVEVVTSSVATPAAKVRELIKGMEAHAQATSVAKQLSLYDGRVGYPAVELSPSSIRDHWEYVIHSRKLPKSLGSWALTTVSLNSITSLHQIGSSILAESKAGADALKSMDLLGGMRDAGPGAIRKSSQSVGERIDSLNQLLSAEVGLLPHADLLRLHKHMQKTGLMRVVTELTESRPPVNDVLTVFRSIVRSAQADNAIRSTPSLAQFTTSKHHDERMEFQSNDKAMLTENRGRILSAVASRRVTAGAGRTASDMTQHTLLKREQEKKKRHIPIRKLVSRAGTAMQDLCPCWLMTPLAVAQYLPPGGIDFDLIVMDEASQLTPEDAFGAIARGKEAVIVGDPAQMPPSNFFQSTVVADTDDADEESEASLAESVLELAKVSLPEASLLWHYRSQHQELIAPANAFSYNSRLILFPSAVDRREDLGIRYHHVPDGFFSRQVNTAEARAVVGYIIAKLKSFENISPQSRPSIGVLTMNLRQQEAVSAMLDQARQGDALVARIMMEEESRSEEPLIVRNLENFQGDQRDIIVLSCTYGPENPGSEKVHQRFASINGQAGKRRFNVAITRAKQQMVVFATLRSQQVLIGEGKNEGVVDLHRFLKFCERDRRTGIPDLGVTTGNTMDSPFEEAVADFLASSGFKVEPQVGVSGYFIDLAIRHPDDHGRFAIGIECDGATYHSSRAARDRDHLREEILKERGWNLHRIWSTDWFYNQARAKMALLSAVRSACG